MQAGAAGSCHPRYVEDTKLGKADAVSAKLDLAMFQIPSSNCFKEALLSSWKPHQG